MSRREKGMPYVETTSVHLSVTWYQRLNRLSLFMKLGVGFFFQKLVEQEWVTRKWARGTYKENFSTFSPDFDKSLYRRCPQKCIEWFGFHGNRLSESHTSLRGVNEFLSVLPTFIFQFVWNSIKRSAHNGVEYLWVSENQRRKGRTFLMGVNEIAFARVPYNSMSFWK